MKKILTICAILLLTAVGANAATSFTNNIKNAAKNDANAIKKAAKNDANAIKANVKDKKDAYSKAVKQDMANKKQAKDDAAQAKKAEKIKYIDAKISDLENQKKLVKQDKTITEIERTFKLRSIEKQLEIKKNEKAALQ